MATETQWVIISMKEGRGTPYWRPNAAGYTDSVTDAGKYSEAEARQHVLGSHSDNARYCLEDPALQALIGNQSMVRGKELKLWLELREARAALAATPAAPDAGLLGELARLDALATLGPWAYCTNGNSVQSHAIPGVCSGISPKKGNAALICAMRNALPALLARHGAPAAAWVACSERLPEADGEYLVYGDCTGSGVMVDIAIFCQYHRTGPKTFHKANQPTHWAPLPTPPTQP